MVADVIESSLDIFNQCKKTFQMYLERFLTEFLSSMLNLLATSVLPVSQGLPSLPVPGSTGGPNLSGGDCLSGRRLKLFKLLFLIYLIYFECHFKLSNLPGGGRV